MPYNIWCGGCNSHIGMGVRYNAEKKKVGNYYSTPIWQFRMKCHLCDNYFEINTDPQVWGFLFWKNLIYIYLFARRKYIANFAMVQTSHTVYFLSIEQLWYT